MRMPTGLSSRRDSDTGIVEEVGFFGPHVSSIFGSTCLPAGEADAGVIVCSPIKSEFMKNYRNEVILARALAMRGLAVQRFHYRGTGHSGGESSTLTFERLVQDALSAADLLAERADVRQFAFVGTRLGGLVAAAAAARHGAAPLVLWEPVLEPTQYFREVVRTRLIREIGTTTTAPRLSTTALLEQLRREGFIDVLGFSIDRSLYETACGHSLEGELGEQKRPILWVQFGRSQELRGGYAKAIDRLERSGFSVTVELVANEVAWWFQETERSTATWVDSLVATTSEWLSAAMSSQPIS